MPRQPHPTPSGRYDSEGNLYIDFPADIDQLQVETAYAILRRNYPPGTVDIEDGFRGVIWVDWRQARRAEEFFRGIWPALTVRAEGNPWYRQGTELAARLAEARAAIATAEAIVARPPTPTGFGERAVRTHQGEGGAA